MPVAEILLISEGASIDDNNIIEVDDYNIIRDNTSLINSSQETIKIVTESANNEITVRYAVYGDIQNIQNFYISPDRGIIIFFLDSSESTVG